MSETDETVEEPVVKADGKPTWRKILDFPLVAMVVAFAVLAAAIAASGFLLAPFDKPEGDFLLMGVPVLLAVTAATLAMKLIVSRLGENPRDDMPFNSSLNDLWRGTFFAAVLMSVMVGIAALLGGYRILGWGSGDSWEIIFLVAGVQAAVLEEIIFRGIVFRFLEEFAGSWAALLISALIFGFIHISNPNATVFSSIAIAVEAGMLLGGAYMLTRNLWLAIGIHFGWNVVQGFVWDVPVSGIDVDGMVQSQASGNELISGGAFGLEASLIALVLATSAGVWLVWKAWKKGEVMSPWWVRRKQAKLSS